MKRTCLLLCIIVIALLSRIIFLDRIPTGVSNDEIDYLLNAKSVFLAGSDISHTWNPLTFSTPKSSPPQAEIAPILSFLFVGPLSFSLLNAKLIYVFFSLGIILLIYTITKNLIGEEESVVVGLVAAWNPWLIFFGRTAYDTTLAVFFYLLGFYLLLRTKKWHILMSFPAFFIAFYAYIGTKLLLLPFVAVVSIYAWSTSRKYKRWYLLLFMLCIAVVTNYMLSIARSPEARVHELANINIDSIVSTVNYERRLSIQSPLTLIFSNKYVVFIKYLLNKYFTAFSPNFLFLSGDGKGQFSLWTHGTFYYLDAPFLLIGFAVLFMRKKKVLYLFCAIIFIAPIPSVLSTAGTSYAIRSMLLAPMLIIFIGIGIYYVLKNVGHSWIIISILYFVLILNFINIYFLQNSVYNSESFNFSARELARYLSFQSGTVYVINGNPKTPYKQYLFYNNGLNKNTVGKIASDFKNNIYSINNIHFIRCTQINEVPPGSIEIYDKCIGIPRSHTDVLIAQFSDGGTIFTISNDTLCNRYRLSHYPSGMTFADLLIEKLSAKDFCTKFITKY